MQSHVSYPRDTPVTPGHTIPYIPDIPDRGRRHAKWRSLSIRPLGITPPLKIFPWDSLLLYFFGDSQLWSTAARTRSFRNLSPSPAPPRSLYSAVYSVLCIVRSMTWNLGPYELESGMICLR